MHSCWAGLTNNQTVKPSLNLGFWNERESLDRYFDHANGELVARVLETFSQNFLCWNLRWVLGCDPISGLADLPMNNPPTSAAAAAVHFGQSVTDCQGTQYC